MTEDLSAAMSLLAGAALMFLSFRLMRVATSHEFGAPEHDRKTSLSLAGSMICIAVGAALLWAPMIIEFN